MEEGLIKSVFNMAWMALIYLPFQKVPEYFGQRNTPPPVLTPPTAPSAPSSSRPSDYQDFLIASEQHGQAATLYDQRRNDWHELLEIYIDHVNSGPLAQQLQTLFIEYVAFFGTLYPNDPTQLSTIPPMPPYSAEWKEEYKKLEDYIVSIRRILAVFCSAYSFA